MRNRPVRFARVYAPHRDQPGTYPTDDGARVLSPESPSQDR